MKCEETWTLSLEITLSSAQVTPVGTERYQVCVMDRGAAKDTRQHLAAPSSKGVAVTAAETRVSFAAAGLDPASSSVQQG